MSANETAPYPSLLFNLDPITLVFSRRIRWPGCCTVQVASFLCPGGIVSRRVLVAVLTTLTLMLALNVRQLGAQSAPNNEELLRRAKSKAQPTYPELARRMNISGTVKIEVVVAPNGRVKEARVIGGHPVLATSALDAAKRWRFEPAPAESTGIIDFKFEPR